MASPRSLVLLLAVTGVLGAGCSDDEPAAGPVDGPSPPTAATSSAGPATSRVDTPSATPSPSPSPRGAQGDFADELLEHLKKTAEGEHVTDVSVFDDGSFKMTLTVAVFTDLPRHEAVCSTVKSGDAGAAQQSLVLIKSAQTWVASRAPWESLGLHPQARVSIDIRDDAAPAHVLRTQTVYRTGQVQLVCR